MLRIYLVSKFQQGRSSRVGGIVSPQFDLYRNPGTVPTFNDRVNLQSGAVSIVSHSGPDRLRIYPQVPNHHRFEQETEGSQVAPEPLGVSVKSCRCQRGIHQAALGGLSKEGPRAKPCRPRTPSEARRGTLRPNADQVDSHLRRRERGCAAMLRWIHSGRGIVVGGPPRSDHVMVRRVAVCQHGRSRSSKRLRSPEPSGYSDRWLQASLPGKRPLSSLAESHQVVPRSRRKRRTGLPEMPLPSRAPTRRGTSDASEHG